MTADYYAVYDITSVPIQTRYSVSVHHPTVFIKPLLSNRSPRVEYNFGGRYD